MVGTKTSWIRFFYEVSCLPYTFHFVYCLFTVTFSFTSLPHYGLSRTSLHFLNGCLSILYFANMHCTFLSSALLFSAAARFASAQDATLTTSLDSAQTTSFDSAQTTSFDSAQTTSYNSAQTTADSAEPSLDPLVSFLTLSTLSPSL